MQELYGKEIVSEELSSVETIYNNDNHGIYVYEFQKNLVVWKLTCS